MKDYGKRDSSRARTSAIVDELKKQERMYENYKNARLQKKASRNLNLSIDTKDPLLEKSPINVYETGTEFLEVLSPTKKTSTSNYDYKSYTPLHYNYDKYNRYDKYDKYDKYDTYDKYIPSYFSNPRVTTYYTDGDYDPNLYLGNRKCYSEYIPFGPANWSPHYSGFFPYQLQPAYVVGPSYYPCIPNDDYVEVVVKKSPKSKVKREYNYDEFLVDSKVDGDDIYPSKKLALTYEPVVKENVELVSRPRITFDSDHLSKYDARYRIGDEIEIRPRKNNRFIAIDDEDIYVDLHLNRATTRYKPHLILDAEVRPFGMEIEEDCGDYFGTVDVNLTPRITAKSYDYKPSQTISIHRPLRLDFGSKDTAVLRLRKKDIPTLANYLAGNIVDDAFTGMFRTYRPPTTRTTHYTTTTTSPVLPPSLPNLPSSRSLEYPDFRKTKYTSDYTTLPKLDYTPTKLDYSSTKLDYSPTTFEYSPTKAFETTTVKKVTDYDYDTYSHKSLKKVDDEFNDWEWRKAKRDAERRRLEREADDLREIKRREREREARSLLESSRNNTYQRKSYDTNTKTEIDKITDTNIYNRTELEEESKNEKENFDPRVRLASDKDSTDGSHNESVVVREMHRIKRTDEVSKKVKVRKIREESEHEPGEVINDQMPGVWQGRGHFKDERVIFSSGSGYIDWKIPKGSLEVIFKHPSGSLEFSCSVEPGHKGMKIFEVREDAEVLIANGKVDPKEEGLGCLDFTSIDGVVIIVLETYDEDELLPPYFRLDWKLK